jgi:hypothetical protein
MPILTVSGHHGMALLAITWRKIGMMTAAIRKVLT